MLTLLLSLGTVSVLSQGAGLGVKPMHREELWVSNQQRIRLALYADDLNFALNIQLGFAVILLFKTG